MGQPGINDVHVRTETAGTRDDQRQYDQSNEAPRSETHRGEQSERRQQKPRPVKEATD